MFQSRIQSRKEGLKLIGQPFYLKRVLKEKGHCTTRLIPAVEEHKSREDSSLLETKCFQTDADARLSSLQTVGQFVLFFTSHLWQCSAGFASCSIVLPIWQRRHCTASFPAVWVVWSGSSLITTRTCTCRSACPSRVCPCMSIKARTQHFLVIT